MDRESVKDVLREEKKRRRSKGRGMTMQLFAMLACLIVLVVLMYGGLTIYTLFMQKPVETMQDNVSGLGLDDDGNVVNVDEGEDVIGVISDAVVYSQEELDERIAEAVSRAQAEASTEVLDAIKLELLDGKTAVQALRPLYPDDIVAYYSGQYYFVPINRELAQSQFRTENLNILENGEVQYILDGQVVSHKGIDVSTWNGTIDWNLVAQDGVEFAFIRVGFRGYGAEGKLVEDDQFVANIEGAQAAGIKVGVYFFSQAITEEEALEEADFILERIAPYQLDCPVIIDVERNDRVSSARMNNISLEESTNQILLFCQTIENAGYKPMIYYNLEWGVRKLDPSMLEKYDKWFAAHETDDPYYPYEYKVWQYSQTGRVQGISGDVDLNISFESIWETSE